ncbi:MAG TPA: exopolysaccharide biosynthesis polyprenyl glycosylphosphotransferase [Gemmatimonadaceae bacterium]|nr:exopolysaccharide biosynthesis polyprenyl glycosylphosphotransferase [Gemmatimonadaceae bacterium]
MGPDENPPIVILTSTTAEAKVLRHPGLLRRSALLDRRPRAIRRHTGRVATRFAVLLLGDVFAILLAKLVAVWLAAETVDGAIAYAGTPLIENGARFIWVSLLILTAVFATGGHSRHRALNLPFRLFLAVGGVVLLTWAGGIARGLLPSLVLPMVMTAGTVWLSLYLVRQLSEWVLRDVWPGQRGAGVAILVGDTSHADRYGRAVAAPGGDYRVAGYVATSANGAASRSDHELIGTIENLSAVISEHDAEAVVVCDDLPASRINDLIEECLHAGCQILFPARAVRVYGLRPTLVWHHDQPFFELGSPVLKARALISKRIVDVVVSSILLALLSPVLLAIIIAIRLDSAGSPFFLQERAGLGGRRFRMFKFRTMHVGADDEKQNLAHLNHTGDRRLFKIPNDPRTTRLGRFLRRWSLDELPQLANVLIGDMSLIGPRPFFESDFAEYEDHHFRRLDAKPGITGLWQVSGRSEVVDFEDVIFLDRQYIEQWSFWLDVSILFRTIPAVLRRTGAF